MLAILNSLNAHNFPIFQPILMILVSKFMVRRAFSDKTYLSLGLLSPLIIFYHISISLRHPLEISIAVRKYTIFPVLGAIQILFE